MKEIGVTLTQSALCPKCNPFGCCLAENCCMEVTITSDHFVEVAELL